MAREIWEGDWLLEPLPVRMRGHGWYQLMAEDGSTAIIKGLYEARKLCRKHPDASSIPEAIRGHETVDRSRWYDSSNYRRRR